MDTWSLEDPQLAWHTGLVEQIVINVLVHDCDHAIELVSVVDNGNGWNVVVRTQERRLKLFRLAPGTRSAMRAAIMQAIDP